MRIGYACKTMGMHTLQQRTTTRKHATPDKLHELIAHNLDVLEQTLLYNRENGITLFRVSSDLIPLATAPENTLDWQTLFVDRFAAVGAAAQGLRLSMHPGQYTVLNSPDERVVRGAIAELEYHAAFLDALGLDTSHKLILHIGGVYGDKAAAAERFVQNYRALDTRIRRRLVLENDDKMYHIADVLRIAERTGAPVVFDTLHHTVHPPDEPSAPTRWIGRCAATWREGDGAQKIHHSQQAPGKSPGSHSETIDPRVFLDLAQSLPENVDVMLEVKDKNLSAIKCLTCLRPSMKALEREWSRYKYLVLEHSQPVYLAIRALLKDKSAAPALGFYDLVQQALSTPPQNVRSAAEHVWGYFKTLATPTERSGFQRALQQQQAGELALSTLKKRLWRLALKHQQGYLLYSYYFLSIL